MQYLFIIRVLADADPTAEEADPTAWVEDTTRRGVRLFGEQLRPADEATTIRRQGDELIVVDGPYAESRELVAGFDLIEAGDAEEAVAVAAAHPVTGFGSIEIRAIWPFDEESA